MRDFVIDRVREFAVNSFDVIWVHNRCADQVEDKRPDSKASNDDARNETWAIGEPEPAMLNRYHVSQAIANTKSDRKEADKGCKSGRLAGYEDCRQTDRCSNANQHLRVYALSELSAEGHHEDVGNEDHWEDESSAFGTNVEE